MTWTKITKRAKLKPARTQPAVGRTSNGRGGLLILPRDYVTGKRATFYSDGNGKLAVQMADEGDYMVFSGGKGSLQMRVTIPAEYRDRIPFGTTDVTLTRDGDMWVLDLNSIGAEA